MMDLQSLSTGFIGASQGGSPMDFDIFKKLALTTVVGNQNENGSWSGDLIATISAIEALCEEISGPDPVCRFSGLYSKLHPEIAPQGWLFRFASGVPNGTPLMQAEHPLVGYLTAIYQGIAFGRKMLPTERSIDEASAWALSKWSRMNVLTDPDFQLHIPEEALKRFSTREAWLRALLGQSNLHENAHRAAYNTDLTIMDRHDIVSRADSLVELISDDHWQSATVTAEEATAITGSFLFHECTVRVCNGSNPRIDLSALRDRVLQWLVDRQSPSGGWADSAHVTSHCLKLVDAALCGVQSDQIQYSGWLHALRRAVCYLLQSDVQTQWTALITYQQIDVLTVLIRLSKRPVLKETVFRGMQVDGTAFRPDVFVSYGGPDADFARRLARDLECAGVRVWFAEWDLDYGDDVLQEIEAGLNSTKKFIIILSPEAIQRPWVRKELSAAFQQSLSGPGKLIVPVMYRRCDPPPFLSTYRWADFTNNEEYAKHVRELTRRLKGQRPPRI
jgi:TIR domain